MQNTNLKEKLKRLDNFQNSLFFEEEKSRSFLWFSFVSRVMTKNVILVFLDWLFSWTLLSFLSNSFIAISLLCEFYFNDFQFYVNFFRSSFFVLQFGNETGLLFKLLAFSFFNNSLFDVLYGTMKFTIITISFLSE